MDMIRALGLRFSPRRSWTGVIALPLIGVALGLIGPFGAYVSMTPLQRILHFALCFTVMGLLVIEGSYRVARYGFQGRWPLWAALCFDLVCVVISTGIVWVSLRVFAPNVLTYVGPAELGFQNLLIFAIIRAAIVAMGLWSQTQLAHIPAAPLVQDTSVHQRLPFALKGAQILALTAEDHYLRVCTSRGEALIHLTLSEAASILEGFQVHRSHWVSAQAVRDYDATRVYLVTGASLPLSRHRRKAFEDWLKHAGVTPA